MRCRRATNIVIAVIDTSVDVAHPELAGVVAGTFDATGAGEKPQPHGTAMAGAIAAHGQLIGTAPGVKMLSIQAFGTTRSEGTSFNILKGLEWAVRQNADIINMSFAGPADPALQVLLAAARSKGVVLIAAAGNAGPRSRSALSGGRSERDRRDGDRSGRQAVRSRQPRHAHRGRGARREHPGAAPNGGYELTSGTSVAAAEVSGVVALMLERNRTLDPGEVRRSPDRDRARSRTGRSGRSVRRGAGRCLRRAERGRREADRERAAHQRDALTWCGQC